MKNISIYQTALLHHRLQRPHPMAWANKSKALRAIQSVTDLMDLGSQGGDSLLRARSGNGRCLLSKRPRNHSAGKQSTSLLSLLSLSFSAPGSSCPPKFQQWQPATSGTSHQRSPAGLTMPMSSSAWDKWGGWTAVHTQGEVTANRVAKPCLTAQRIAAGYGDTF